MNADDASNEANAPDEPGNDPTEEAPTREASTEPLTAAQPPPPPPPPPRRFLRSRDDRVIAGVAGGLGRYFDIDPVIVRIAAIVSIFFGGLGVIAYLITAIIVPADDGTGNPAPGSRGSAAIRILGIGALVLIGIGGFALLVVAAVVATGLGYGLVAVGAIVLLGIALIAASFGSGARWLILPALALTIGVGVATAADLNLKGGVGKRDYHPVSAAVIPADGYELGIGRLAIDLRDIDWGEDRVLDLDARVGVGQLVVAVPSGVCVEADAHAGAGDLVVAGQQVDGAGVDLRTGEGARGTPRLRIDAEVDLGQITIVSGDHADISSPDRWDGGWDDRFGGNPTMREANARACAA